MAWPSRCSQILLLKHFHGNLHVIVKNVRAGERAILRRRKTHRVRRSPVARRFPKDCHDERAPRNPSKHAFRFRVESNPTDLHARTLKDVLGLLARMLPDGRAQSGLVTDCYVQSWSLILIGDARKHQKYS
jgi:hypothetical protein